MQHNKDDRDVTERVLGRCREIEAEEQEDSLGHIGQEPAGRYGHRYGGITISDDSRAHIGDTIVHHHNGLQPQLNEYETLLTSLTFDRMDARLRNIMTALPKTCEWLFRHGQFVLWTDGNKIHEHHGFLWIKGKPGSGKSTIMKVALGWAEQHWSAQIILSYFFNARSSGWLEKSALGLYRSLLYQLLRVYPGSRELFKRMFVSKVRDGKVEEWTEAELQNFFLQLISTSQLPLVTIFIDAIDEGSDDDIRRMVKFLARLTRDAAAIDRPLRICLSSRHYPYITIEKSLSLIVENQPEHSQDIELYVRSELAEGDSPQMDKLRRDLLARSSGIFLWIILVVPMLNKAYDQGKTSMAMLRKLEGIPPDLHDLFAQIFSKDLEDLDECITLLKWVLFSKKPLRPIELYHAVQYTCLKTGIEENMALTQDVVVRYLLDCSRGFVELTKARRPLVQFIHETVRDYLGGRHVLAQRQPGVSISHVLGQDLQAGSCHMKLSEACLYYLLNISRKARLTWEVFEHYPLARYAAEFWWQHLQLSQSPCSQKVMDLAMELLIGSHLWRAADALASPLYYAAWIGVPELASSIAASGVDVNAQGGQHGDALQTAIVCGHDKVVQILVDAGADITTEGGYYSSALRAASVKGYERIVQILVDAGADVNAEGGYLGSALQAALAKGYEKIVQILVDAGVDVNAQEELYGSALWDASARGHERIVQILLDARPNVNIQEAYYRRALQAAILRGHENIVQILPQHRAMYQYV